jgi:hypothetical protein
MHTCNGEQIPMYECSRMTLWHSRFIPIVLENTSTLAPSSGALSDQPHRVVACTRAALRQMDGDEGKQALRKHGEVAV